MHVPAATSVTVDPLTVHTPATSDEKLTGRPEEAVAVTVNGGVPIVLSAGRRNGCLIALGDREAPVRVGRGAVIGVAGLCGAGSCTCRSRRTSRQRLRRCTTAAVVDMKVTGRPEDAVALTVSGVASNVLLPSVVNVIVWLALATVKLWSTLGAAA